MVRMLEDVFPRLLVPMLSVLISMYLVWEVMVTLTIIAIT
jgi:hypothetical protein